MNSRRIIDGLNIQPFVYQEQKVRSNLAELSTGGYISQDKEEDTGLRVSG